VSRRADPCSPLVPSNDPRVVSRSPMHIKLIDVSLLTAPEKKWINEYHKEIWEKVSPLLNEDKRALEWLKRETREI
jgi:Xaa-Pro aminopeptidase